MSEETKLKPCPFYGGGCKMNPMPEREDRDEKED